MSKIEYEELITFHPGYYIKDIIESLEMTQEEFAKRLGVSGKTISNLLSGKIPLSNDIALKLSTMLGTSINTWLNLQKTYDEKVLEIEKRKRESIEIDIVKIIDYNYFVLLGFVEDTKDRLEQVKNLCNYFKVASLQVFREKDFLVNYRVGVSSVNEKNVINSRAWLQTAINCGKEIETLDFNEKLLKLYLPEIRRMTLEKPSEFLPRLRKIFAECGVSFILLPHLKNSGINGAVKWINSNKVILALNDRRSYADTFWFSLFHEIKHVLQQKLKITIVNLTSMEEINEIDKTLEEDADKFAQDYLIPKNKYDEFLEHGLFNEMSITSFANAIDLHSGIVVGRLQKDKKINYNKFNHLKKQYIIKY